jgi:diguanylate cyclase (GGDEF)-like protein
LLEDRGDRRADGAGARAPLRLLLVEPDPRVAVWVGEMLRASWREPVVLAHAERLGDAVADLAGSTTDCIVVDVSPNDPDWPAAIEQLRGAAADVAIVALSDGGDEEAAITALRAGAQDCLPKPHLSPAQLRRVLQHAIERKHAEVALAHRALHDSLTSLPNRALFEDRLGVALDRARRSGALVAVLFLDVDNFKDINDTRGHMAGDRLLVELAERLRTMLRPMDTVARFGGDEFTFLFEDLADEREVVLIAERIARACRAPIALEPGEATVTVSMGIAMVTDPRTPAETLIRQADAAMYRAKEGGRGRYELFDESTRERALERLELEVELRRALDERQLRVHYQPSFSLSDTDAVVGLEALLRWEHPSRGMLGAEDFIALAEETGLVLEIGQYVLTEVLRPLSQWRLRRPAMTISVNLSLRELEDIGFLAMLTGALRAADVEPEALCLEVAENALARNPVVARRVLRALKDMGVQTAIDDFGIGPSSVLALRRLPVDAVKIHGSLLAELGSDPEETPVVAALVELAHALGLRVVAEGVESPAQVEELRALGCDRMQGFLLARPVPEEDVESLLNRVDGEEEYEYSLS